MPRYDYACPDCGVFEAVGGRDERFMECAGCGGTAERRPFSGYPAIKGETVATAIPDAMYRNEAQKRELNRTWGTGERSMEMLRAARKEDKEGRVYVDTPSLAR